METSLQDTDGVAFWLAEPDRPAPTRETLRAIVSCGVERGLLGHNHPLLDALDDGLGEEIPLDEIRVQFRAVLDRCVDSVLHTDILTSAPRPQLADLDADPGEGPYPSGG